MTGSALPIPPQASLDEVGRLLHEEERLQPPGLLVQLDGTARPRTAPEIPGPTRERTA